MNKYLNQLSVFATVVVLAVSAGAETVVDVTGTGIQKISVAVQVSNPAFAKCLSRNLEISGLFSVGQGGAIRVTGVPGAIRAEGNGRVVPMTTPFADDKSARMAARQLADAMCQTYSNGQQPGFASDRVLFLNRGRAKGKGTARPSELCVGYADGWDIRQLTSDAKMTIFPRWKSDGSSIYYISDKNGAPQIWEMNTLSGQRRTRWSFKGTPTGIAVSPDGSRVAAVLSFQGNPELYILEGERYIRLTNTPFASEGQPTWSPDGRQIAFVSDETRQPQIYVIDVATRKKRRLTTRGVQNIDPDWGADGRITYITRRAGAQVAVMSADRGDSASTVLDAPGVWEHPSWAKDKRHVVASSNGKLFILDTLENGDKPRQMFSANGNWISPTWMK